MMWLTQLPTVVIEQFIVMADLKHRNFLIKEISSGCLQITHTQMPLNPQNILLEHIQEKFKLNY